MLYLSSKSRSDTYTAHKTIHTAFANDGGLFLPFRLPKLEEVFIRSLPEHTPSKNMADVLNIFFSTGITELDLDFSVGKHSMRLSAIHPRVIIGELWHNANWNYDTTVQAVSDALRRENKGDAPTEWVRTAVRIASIFALYGQAAAEGAISMGESMDIAVPVGDFSGPISAWYARKMGLPIGTIICGCNENSALWDLFNLADMSTGDSVSETLTPLCDHQVPASLSRLIYHVLGAEEAIRYEEICQAGRHYAPPEDMYNTLKEGIFTAVSSISRVDSVIRNVSSTTGYILSPYDALAYGALLDYRNRSGQGSHCLLISERCPICDDKTTAYALGITTDELVSRLQVR